jgi:DnaJ-domain-containing protein 1
MDVANYYITTLTNAFGNLLPIGGFLLLGYFLFLRLPLNVMVKIMKENRSDVTPVEISAESANEGPELLGAGRAQAEAEEKEKLRREREQHERLKYQEARRARDQARQERTHSKSKQDDNKSRKEEVKAEGVRKQSAEEALFEMRAGQRFTKKELKQKYHELLKMNHPDKVASMGPDFKVMAEKKTKAINSAYEKLKTRAA